MKDRQAMSTNKYLVTVTRIVEVKYEMLVTSDNPLHLHQIDDAAWFAVRDEARVKTDDVAVTKPLKTEVVVDKTCKIYDVSDGLMSRAEELAARDSLLYSGPIN